VLIIVLVGVAFLISVPEKVFADFEVKQSSIEPDASFDLVVYSGEPEGVTAALAGARNGLKTLLVMEEDGPGGLIVYGALNFLDLNYDEKGKNIHWGIFKEWHQMVGGDVIVDTEEARLAFIKLLLTEENLTIIPMTRLKGHELSKDGQRITQLIFETTGISRSHDALLNQTIAPGSHPAWRMAAKGIQAKATVLHRQRGTLFRVAAKTFIDASPDADLAAAVGVPYFFGGADIGLPDRKMAATLVFRLSNVDWKALEGDVKSQKWGTSRMNATSVWGLGDIGFLYRPLDEATRLRGLNIARQKDGTVFINALLIFDVNVLDPVSLQKGMARGKAEAYHVVEYLRRDLAGFKNVELMPFPPQLYVRESRHILALYQLDVLDLVERVDFPDKIAVSSYPIDFQATSPQNPGYVICTPGVYSIPFRSLVPRNMVNLLVVGRSAGYTSLAAGSTRVIPTGMATAEAAGVAAAMVVGGEMNFHELAADPKMIQYLQGFLLSQGVNLHKIQGKSQLARDPDYSILKELFGWGFLSAGYDNNLRLDQVITEREFAFLLSKGLRQRQAEIYNDLLINSLYAMSTNRPLDRYKASEMLLTAVGDRLEPVDDSYLAALKRGFIPSDLDKRWSMTKSQPLTRREIYKLAVPLFRRYPVQDQLLRLRSRGFNEH
jgi:hypothetical protein